MSEPARGRGRPRLTPEEAAARAAARPQVDAVTVRLTPDVRALLETLQTVLGGSQGDVVAAGLAALDREMRRRQKRRKGPAAVVA